MGDIGELGVRIRSTNVPNVSNKTLLLIKYFIINIILNHAGGEITSTNPGCSISQSSTVELDRS